MILNAWTGRRKGLCTVVVLLAGLSGGCQTVAPLDAVVVIPRAAAGPVLDGVLDDDCWGKAILLTSFSRADSLRAPAKRVEVRLAFDDKMLYIGTRCAEPDPKRLRAEVTVENDGVWVDDCVEVFIRASDDYLDYDQFIVNPLGTREWHHVRGLPKDPAEESAFRVRTVVGEDAWTAEFAIPFADLGISAPRPGDAIGLKICRNDRASKQPQLVVWPPGARYSGPTDYATVFFAEAGRASRRDVATVGPAIPVRADAAEPTVIRKLLVADCRAVRGFIGTPVDGSAESFGWDGGFWEYNKRGAGAGVGYHYRNNDGLHIKLADDGGFHALQVRGGVKATLYRDVPSWTGPAGGTLVAKLPGGTRGTTRAWFEDPVRTASVSFFDVTDGYIADVSFFRISQGVRGLPDPERLAVARAVKGAHVPRRLASRFAKEDRTRHGLRPDAKPLGAIALPSGRWVHLIGEPFDLRTPLVAIGLDFQLKGAGAPFPLTIRIQDAVDTRRELYVADVEVNRPGYVRIVCDFPDQVLPPESQVWLSLRSEKAVRLVKPSVDLYIIDRKAAAPEALAYRKLLLHGMYVSMSEARPWNGWYYRDKVAEWLKSDSRYVPGVQNILDALDHCRYIGADDEVRQYYEWIWRGVLRKAGETPAFETKFDRVKGAPEWACLARQAWLQARAVPQWWMDHRLVPTGEFGGRIGDDTDMYQNYADFVMFEDAGVASRLKDAGARLAELAYETTMIEGVNRRTMDPLHAYEEGLNQDALMAFWHYGDPVYLERCMDSARSMEWLTWVTPRGHRHFRSQQIGAARRNDPRTDVDGHAHPLMWHPTFELVRYNRNPTALKWLRQWGDGWLEHMKPGEYAKSVEVATEKVVASEKRPLPGGYGGQGSAFESLYWITGDVKYLSPFMDVYRTGKAATRPAGLVAELYQRGALDDVGDKLDAVVKADPVAFAQATGDKGPLCEALRKDITELQRYGALYTTVEPFTDRVFLYAITNAAKAYTGGFATRNKFCRTHAVSYEGFGTDYAALVMAARADRFKVLLHNFAEGPLKGRLRFWTLQHGNYALTAGVDADLDDKPDRIDRRDIVEIMRASTIDVTLPPGKLTVLELRLMERLDDERRRADLALSPLDTKVTPGTVESIAHNIGGKNASRVTVALVDADGKIKQRKALGPLPAPVDLVPIRLPFRFDGLPADPTGWSIVVDPDDKLREIYEGNNAVKLGE